jgi:hypothetical protein
VRQPEWRETRNRGSEPGDETARDRVRGDNADLLPDDRSDACLEGVPGSGNPDPAAGPHDRSDHVVAGEVPLGFGDVQVEAADAARALDHVDQLFPVREVYDEHDLLATARSKLDHAWVAIDDDRAPVRVARDLLHARDRARAEVLDQRGPVERCAIPKPEWQPTVGDEAVGNPTPGPQLTW